MAGTLNILPKWQKFAKSGHTELRGEGRRKRNRGWKETETEHEGNGI